MSKRFISDHYHAILEDLEEGRKAGDEDGVAAADLQAGAGVHSKLARMEDRGWVERVRTEQTPAGWKLAYWRITQLGRLALDYARAERVA